MPDAIDIDWDIKDFAMRKNRKIKFEFKKEVPFSFLNIR